MKTTSQPTKKSPMKIFLFIILCAFILLAMARMQHRMIYYPRGYDSRYKDVKNVIELQFQTGQGSQTAFYYPPRGNKTIEAERIWFIFGGNASLALDWYDFVSRYPDPQAGFLLLDYPGYGKCKGTATPESIRESSHAAVTALAELLNLDREILLHKMLILGHSIGAAAALQFCAQEPMKKIILISPFTSLKDMAAKVVGGPLSYFLVQNYDNRARLAELAAQDQPPQVIIFHGSNDNIVPVSMGRELAGLHPKLITYHEIAKTGHNNILSMAEKEIYTAMQSD